ncbi:MAG: hypothetical protein ACRC33_01670 [Gemmataceae bacterium]
MPAACAMCGNVYDNAGACPRCGGRPDAPSGVGPRWLHTVAGRLFIGLIVSQGLFYALERLLTGVLLAVQGGTAQELWTRPTNLVYIQAAQLIAALAGGAMAGGGQAGALSLGAIVGAWNGVLAIIFRQAPAEILGSFALYTSPLMHAAVASVGAAVGAWVWRPVTDVDTAPVLASTKKKPKPTRPLFEGRIAWVGVAFGTALAVAGTLYAGDVFKKVLDLSGGKLGTDSTLQDRIIVWELRGMALLMAGFIAGATTANGLKQGLAVSIGASIILIGIQSSKPGDLVEAVAVILVSTFGLGMVGGWFGGALFPPVAAYRRRSAAQA